MFSPFLQLPPYPWLTQPLFPLSRPSMPVGPSRCNILLMSFLFESFMASKLAFKELEYSTTSIFNFGTTTIIVLSNFSPNIRQTTNTRLWISTNSKIRVCEGTVANTLLFYGDKPICTPCATRKNGFSIKGSQVGYKVYQSRIHPSYNRCKTQMN